MTATPRRSPSLPALSRTPLASETSRPSSGLSGLLSDDLEGWRRDRRVRDLVHPTLACALASRHRQACNASKNRDLRSEGQMTKSTRDDQWRIDSEEPLRDRGSMTALRSLYRNRFSDAERERRDAIWCVLCKDFFRRYVRPTDTVLDLASGYGEFSRHIAAAQIVAIDLNPDAGHCLPKNAEFHLASAEQMPFLDDDSIDVAFTSNFFEHLRSKDAMDAVLSEVRRVLRPGGMFIALQPNIRYAYREYWDFYDHQLRFPTFPARRPSSSPALPSSS